MCCAAEELSNKFVIQYIYVSVLKKRKTFYINSAVFPVLANTKPLISVLEVEKVDWCIPIPSLITSEPFVN